LIWFAKQIRTDYQQQSVKSVNSA